MREFKTILSILLVCVPFYFTYGQNKIETKGYTAGQLKSFAKNADRLGDIYTAQDFLEQYCKLKPGDAELNYRLAELYYLSRDYVKAEKQFSKTYKEWPDKFPQALYYQAQSQKSQGKYIEAKDILSRFQRKLKNMKDPPVTASLLRGEIAGCDSAESVIKRPIKIKIEPLGRSVNSPHVDLSPVPVSDSIFYYSSLKIDSVFYFQRDDSTSKPPVRQIYKAIKDGNDWVGGRLIDNSINIPGVETGNGALSRDGNRLYFTRCARNFQGKMICEIYVSTKSNKGWQDPVRLNSMVNDPNYTSTQPTIGYTARSNYEIVYFVSDRPGGRGGYDIWYTIYDLRKKDYLAPKNAGIKINTAGDEITPFYDHSTRTLFYSSNGHQGIGGFDVFSSLGELRKWFDSQNVGYPLNSSYDDLYFTISKNREDGFIVSNRPGLNIGFRNPTCCDDIYQYRWTDFIRLAITGAIYPAEKGKVGRDMDQAQLMAMKDIIPPMKGAIITLYMVDKKTKEKIFIDRDTTAVDGIYFFDLLPDKDYKFEMEGTQYFNEQVNMSTDGINFSYTIEMPPIWVNMLTDKPIVLKNVYYDFDKADLSTTAKSVIDTTLLELLNKASDIIVEVSSHTDSLGNFEYNRKLSQDRAQNVVNYLISKGVNRKRLVAIGYGADKPVAPNFKPDGSDNTDGRDQNRRTEFRIVGTLSSLEEVDSDELTE